MAITEFCEQCRFDSEAYTDQDVAGTLRTLPTWWRLLAKPFSDRAPANTGPIDNALFARPNATTWSAAEYAQHSVDVLRTLTLGLQMLIGDDKLDFGSGPDEQPLREVPATPNIETVFEELDSATAALLAIAKAGEASTHSAIFDGNPLNGPWILRHAVHDALHHLHDAGRGFRELGHGVATQSGVVKQISANDGGVAKTAIESATIGPRGVIGDRQRTRLHHGRTWQAICLYSSEVIERLQADGHPIAPGSVGENLTIAGLDWDSLRPNTLLRIGDDVLLETTVPAVPCKHNAQWFSDGDFNRIHHDHQPSTARWYASVLQGGTIETGAPATIEP